MKKTHLVVFTLGSIVALTAFNGRSNAADTSPGTPPVTAGEPANGTSGGSPNLPAGGNISSNAQSAGENASSAGNSASDSVMSGADRAAGGEAGTAGEMAGSAAKTPSSDQIKEAQSALKKQGLYKGSADGKWGPNSRAAMKEFQAKNGMEETGTLDSKAMSALTSGAKEQAGQAATE